MKKIIVIFIVVSFLSGCGPLLYSRTTGNKIDTQYANQIVDNKTTKDEIRLRLGQPQNVTNTGKNETWLYNYYEKADVSKVVGSLFTGKTPSKTLQFLSIIFEGDIVKSHSLSLSQ